MASGLSDGSEIRRGERHGWNSLEDYLYQHQRRLENYSGFVENHKFDYEIFPTDDEFLLRITMEILCKCDIKLTVEKWAEVKLAKRKKMARTKQYSYNASSPEANILRYDNAHKYPGHSSEHHRHVFNGTGHQIAGSPFHVGEDGWPHMHEVIEELMQRFTPSG